MTGKLKGKLLPLHGSHATDQLSDEALVAACGTGDPSALGALFDRHGIEVRRFVGRLAGADPGDLDDLVQVTFMEVHRSVRRFRGGAQVRSWIFGIAANVVRHHVRGEVRRRAMIAARATLPDGDVPNPAELTERRQLLARVERALHGLKHEVRVVFVMCELEEIPGVDVARALGLRQGTVWRRLHEARRALRKAIIEEKQS